MVSSLCSLRACCAAEVFREMTERAHHRVRREATQSAQRTELHGVAKVRDQRQVLVGSCTGQDLVNGFGAASRADAAGRTLAAAFDSAEFEGKPSLPRHVDGVIEHDNTAMTDEAVASSEGFVVEWCVEQRAREIGAERAADLHGLHWTARGRATANVIYQLTQRHAEGRLEQTAMPDIAGELDWHGAA